jgi:hypothetical protein
LSCVGPSCRWLSPSLFAEGPDASLGFADAFEDGEVGGWGWFLRALDAVAIHEFEGQVAVGFGAAGAGVVECDGFAVAGGFGEAHVAGDGGLEELVVEEVLEVVADLLGEVGAVVEHGEEDAFDGELGVEAGGDAVEGGHELGDAFEGEVLGLHGDEEGVGGDEGVEGEEVERGGAVEEDEGIFGTDGFEAFAETVLAALGGDEFDVGADHVLGAGDQGEVWDVGGEDDFAGGGVAEEEIVDGEAGFVAGEAEAAGGVGLGIDVEQEDGDAFEGYGGGEVDGCGGFADSTLLVDDGDDLTAGGRRERILGIG